MELKNISTQELEAVVRGGLALELGTTLGRPPQSQPARFVYSFQIDYL